MPTKTTLKVKPFLREMAVVDGSINKEKREATFTCSSEFPVERVFPVDGGWIEGWEILEHTEAACDMTRLNDGGSLLDGHWGDVVGATRDAKMLPERELQVTAVYSRSQRGEEIFQDVQDGIRRNVSIRYVIKRIVRTGEVKDGKPVFRVTRWEAVHVAHVADPADPSVGVGRSQEGVESDAEYEDRSQPEIKEINMGDTATLTQADLDKVRVDARKEAEQAISEAEKRETELTAFVEEFGSFEGVREAVREGRAKKQTLTEIGRRVLDLVAKSRQIVDPSKPNSEVGMDKKEVREYSFMNAVRCALGEKKDGLEMEAHRELLKRGFGSNGFCIPWEVQSRKTFDPKTADRDQTVNTGSAGGYLVSSSALSFVDLLRNKQITPLLGVQRVTGLTGNAFFPRQTGASTAYWVSEGGAVTESSLTFGQIAVQPKTIGALNEITRNALMQTNPSIEAMCMGDLAKVLAIGMDLAAVQGSGVSGQPLGVTNWSGIGTFTGSSMTWANLLEAESDLATANADTGTMRFLTTPAVRATLKAREKATGYPIYLWGEDNRLLGYEALVSNQALASAVIFADWSRVIVCEWGSLEIKARDSEANPNTGNIEIIAFNSMDVALTQTGAVTVATSVS